MSNISPSALGEQQLDADFEKAVAQCSTAAEISELMKKRAVTAGLVRRDLYSPDVLIPVEPGTQPRGYARSLIVNGEKVIIEGRSESELNANEAAFYRKTFSGTDHAVATEPTQPRDAASGRFRSPAETVVTEEQRRGLELDYQLGRITLNEYLEKTNAVGQYLENAGVPLAELQATVAEKQDERVTQSWAQATEEFLHSAAGADWPGGENMSILGGLLEANPELLNSPSVETLARVWEHMKENGLAVENPELTARRRIASANSPEEIRAALGQTSSSLFGR